MPSVEVLLTQQVEHLDALQALLDRELHLISVREPDQLLKVVEEKATVLDSIQRIDQEIENALQQRADAVFSEQEQALVDKANAILQTCKHCTAINQKAVEQGQLKLGHLRQLIMDLRARESLTYDKSGKAKGGTLGKGVQA